MSFGIKKKHLGAFGLNKMKSILLTLPSHIVDFKNEIPIGPWVFQGHEEKYPDFYKKNFGNILDGNGEQAKTSLACYWHVKKIIPLLSKDLNKKNNLNLSERFWEGVIGYWLHLLCQIAYVRYLYINAFIQKHGGEKFSIEVTELFSWHFKTTHEFATTTSMENFDCWLSSVILHEQAPSHWILNSFQAKDNATTQPVKNITSSITNKSFSFKESIKYKILNFIKAEASFQAYGTTWKSELLMSVFLKFFKPREKKKIISQKYIENESLPKEFIHIFDKLITLTCPDIFKNSFIKNIVEPLESKSKNKCIISTSNVYRDKKNIEEYFRAEKGALLCGLQHGSAYGVMNSIDASHAIEFNNSLFFTWGWKKHYDFFKAKFIPLPSPLLNKPKLKNKIKCKNDVLFFDKMYNLRSARLSGQPLPHQLLIDLQIKNDFFKKLNGTVKKNLVLRPHAYHANQVDESALSCAKDFSFKSLTTTDSKKVIEAIFNSRIVLCNHYGTTMHQTLAWNVPTILYWDSTVTDLHPEAEKVFQHLIDAKILFFSHEKAAQHLNNVYTDVNSWWLDKKTQDARKLFCQHYARSSKFWLYHWIKAIIKHAR